MTLPLGQRGTEVEHKHLVGIVCNTRRKSQSTVFLLVRVMLSLYGRAGKNVASLLPSLSGAGLRIFTSTAAAEAPEAAASGSKSTVNREFQIYRLATPLRSKRCCWYEQTIWCTLVLDVRAA